MAETIEHLVLPKGWRWLRLGELPLPGDVVVDPRTKPVMIVEGNGSVLTDSHHPVRRGIRKKPK